MSIHTDDLRENGGHLGELAADEIEELEAAYASAFAEIAKLKQLVRMIFETTVPYNDAGESVISDNVIEIWRQMYPGEAQGHD